MNYESSFPQGDESLGLAGPEDERRAKGRKRLIIALVIAAVLLLGIVGYFVTRGGEADAAPADAAADGAQAPVVTVVAPGSETVIRAINATGTIGARYDTPVSIVGEGGRVTQVYVNAGDWVKQGQVLAAVDRSVQNQQAEGLRAQVSVAESSLNLAQAQLNRALQLVDRGFISQADVDRLTAEKERAQAQLRVSRASLNEAQARNARLNVVAPKSGYILERMVEPGQTVTQGSGALFRLAAGGQMEMRALLSEDNLAQVTVGESAQVTPVGTSQTLDGQIWQIAPTIDPTTRQGIARIALSYDRALRPGGFANATIRAGATSAPVLPESAVQSDSEGNYVYVVGPGNKVARRSVQVGTVTDKGLTISSGLSGTELVVVYAGGFLNPGEVVQPRRQKGIARNAAVDSEPADTPAGAE